MAGAFRYVLTRWTALTSAVRSKNYLFASSASGAEPAAALHSLIESAKLNGPT